MVRINGEDKALAGINLLEYLKDAWYQLEKIVVERNLEIIPRDQLENVVIQENDSIEVLRFVGGGWYNDWNAERDAETYFKRRIG